MRRKSRKGVSKSPALRVPLAASFRIFFEWGLDETISGEKGERASQISLLCILRRPLPASFRVFFELGLDGTMCGEKAGKASQSLLFCECP